MKQYSAAAAQQLKHSLGDEAPGYYIETFGCQMNVRDSENISGILEQCGYRPAETRDDAGLILFNTCCVRDHAEKRVFGNIGALRSFKEQRPGRILAISGCMMQQADVAEKLMKRFPFVDLVFGTNASDRLPEMLLRVREGERVFGVTSDAFDVVEGMPTHRAGGASAFVNIMFGCNNFCTYCIVPYVRGRERSRAPEEILAEMRTLVAEGYSEITLLGQNVNSYGLDRGSEAFPALLRQANEIDGLHRLRFMTSHPKDLSDELIRSVAELDKVCHHVHLPMQSGSDDILERMNRRYTRAQYFTIADKLHAVSPDFELTTDIIVGFPGETEADFQDTLDAVRRVGFSAAYTFKYSPRQGTAAAKMQAQVPEAEKRDRLNRLNALQSEITKASNEKYLGFCGEVLVEGCDDRSTPLLFGKYGNFKMVYFPGNADLVGKYCSVRTTSAKNSSLRGEME